MRDEPTPTSQNTGSNVPAFAVPMPQEAHIPSLEHFLWECLLILIGKTLLACVATLLKAATAGSESAIMGSKWG